jgi:nitroreductase
MNTQTPSLDFIFERRSVRVYSPGAIDDATVRRLLEAAMAAPSAMTKDPWRFVVIRSPETLTKLASALPGGKMLSTATLAIMACGDLEAAHDRQLSFLLQDCSAAIENLLLAAHALGLGACWVGVHPDEGSVRRVTELINLPGPIVPVAAIALGLPCEQLPARTRFNPAHVYEENWMRR